MKKISDAEIENKINAKKSKTKKIWSSIVNLKILNLVKSLSLAKTK